AGTAPQPARRLVAVNQGGALDGIFLRILAAIGLGTILRGRLFRSAAPAGTMGLFAPMRSRGPAGAAPTTVRAGFFRPARISAGVPRAARVESAISRANRVRAAQAEQTPARAARARRVKEPPK